MQNYCLKNIQSNDFRKGFCPYQNPLIQVIHLFIIKDKKPYECLGQNPLRISEIMHFQKIIFVFTRNLSYNT